MISLDESADFSTIDSADAALHLIPSPNKGQHHIVKNRATKLSGLALSSSASVQARLAVRGRLLAATPLLWLLQVVLLSIHLLLFAVPHTVSTIEIEPFLEEFLVLIVIPCWWCRCTSRFRSSWSSSGCQRVDSHPWTCRRPVRSFSAGPPRFPRGASSGACATKVPVRGRTGVVTQTPVELVVVVILAQLVPRLTGLTHRLSGG